MGVGVFWEPFLQCLPRLDCAMGKLGMPIKAEGFKKHLGLQAQTARVGGFTLLTAPRGKMRRSLPWSAFWWAQGRDPRAPNGVRPGITGGRGIRNPPGKLGGHWQRSHFSLP